MHCHLDQSRDERPACRQAGIPSGIMPDKGFLSTFEMTKNIYKYFVFDNMSTNYNNYHPVAKKIVELLIAKDMWLEVFEHEAVRTSEEASRARDGYTLSQGAKALIVRAKYKDGTKKFVMFVMPADKKLDSKKAKKSLGIKDMSFASEQEVSDVTGGVMVGGVPPFGNIFNIEVIVDPSLFANEKIVFNAGDRRFSVAMKSEDYRSIVKPLENDIT